MNVEKLCNYTDSTFMDIGLVTLDDTGNRHSPGRTPTATSTITAITTGDFAADGRTSLA